MKLLEEKEPEEVLASPIAGVTVRNFYFDHTPYKLVSKIITERGVLDQQEIQTIADEVSENERWLDKYSLSAQNVNPMRNNFNEL